MGFALHPNCPLLGRSEERSSSIESIRRRAMRTSGAGGALAIGFLLGAFALAAPAAAQEAMPQAAPQQPAEKLGHGLQNGILGWTEVVTRPQAEAAQQGAPGVVKGLLDGVALGTVRTVTGAAEVATFWSPLPVRYQPPVQEFASPLERR
jgi:putative exosortase-associated protein (TIGR04073 family)